MKIDGVTISNGNSKLGNNIPNISLPPGRSCQPGVLCAKACYARKAWKQYPSTRDAWTGNYDIATNNPAKFFKILWKYLAWKKPDRFRIHTAGDFFSQDYVDRWGALAECVPGTRFLAFTKAWCFNFTRLIALSNVSIIFSRWPGDADPPQLATTSKQAWVKIPGAADNRIPTSATECSGDCATCDLCWALLPGQSVSFQLH